MNNFNIETNDLEQIESLLRNNKNIERLYEKLCKLEIEEKKETEEYTKLLDYLSIVIEEEDKIYKNSNLTVERTISWLKFLKQTQSKDNITMRINTTLFQKIINNYNNLLNLSEEELSNILIMSGIKLTIKNKEKKREEICKCIMIKETLHKDIFYVFLSFLQEYINNPRQNMFKEKLIASKYETIFLNKDIEAYAINNNLNLPNNPYIISELVKDLLKIDMILYKKIKDLLSSKIASNEIYKLLETSDLEYNDLEKASLVSIRECMIKSCFLFMSDSQINDLNYNFHEFIEDKEYNIAYPNNKISETIIIDCFKKIKQNKSKIKKLSLNEFS